MHMSKGRRRLGKVDTRLLVSGWVVAWCTTTGSDSIKEWLNACCGLLLACQAEPLTPPFHARTT